MNATQELINESVAKKLVEISTAHNNLVQAYQVLLEEVNKLTHRVAELEEHRRAEAPEIDAENL